MSLPKKLFFLFFLVVLLGIVIFWAAGFFTTMDSEAKLVKVLSGWSAGEIARHLKKEGVIPSEKVFLFLAKFRGASGKFKHGTYLLPKNRTWEIIGKLSAGETYKTKVTIPEGFSAYQIAERLYQQGILKERENFLERVKKEQLEGMLFPETYFFEPESSAEQILETLLAEFRKNFREEFVRRAQELRMSQREILILASIIEREAQIASERAVISSVYHNRLKRRWPLEADPTVQYAIGEGKFWKETITYKDLDVKSPYNTYRRTGLPPGPICNPGLASIQAALHPAQTDYLYFVADGKGGHYFFSEHKKHIQKKLELKKERHLQQKKKGGLTKLAFPVKFTMSPEEGFRRGDLSKKTDKPR